MSTFFIYPHGQFCPSLSALRGWQGTFKRDVNEMASAVGSKRAVIFEEIDFVVNTAQNGQGPKLNPHPVKQGIENLCNPPGRGLGRMPTGDVNPTFDGYTFTGLDGFLWTGVPGRSHNSNCPGGPWQAAGVFDSRFALELAHNANQQLGPGYPSEPY